MLFSHRSLMFATCCLFVALTPCAVSADSLADARKAIQAAYDRASAAIGKKDLNGTMSIYTPDFEMIEKRGTRANVIESRRQIQIMFGMMKEISVSQTVQNATLKGSQAVVSEKTHMEGSMFDPQTKKLRKFVGDNVSEDIWIKGVRGWKLKRSKTLSERTTLDGKPQPGM